MGLCPFNFLTAKTEKEDIRTGKLHGVDDYVTNIRPSRPGRRPGDLSRQLNACKSGRWRPANPRSSITSSNPLTYIVAYMT
jgi:hypothetical protein